MEGIAAVTHRPFAIVNYTHRVEEAEYPSAAEHSPSEPPDSRHVQNSPFLALNPNNSPSARRIPSTERRPRPEPERARNRRIATGETENRITTPAPLPTWRPAIYLYMQNLRWWSKNNRCRHTHRIQIERINTINIAVLLDISSRLIAEYRPEPRRRGATSVVVVVYLTYLRLCTCWPPLSLR